MRMRTEEKEEEKTRKAEGKKKESATLICFD